MTTKTVWAVLIAFVAGAAAIFVIMQYLLRPGGMEHGPGMPTGRELSAEAFGLDVRISPERAKAGEEVVVSARVASKTAPHARTKVSFFVDNKKLEELEGVVPPYQSETAKFRWKAEPGRHVLAVALASPVGIEYARREVPVEVQSP